MPGAIGLLVVLLVVCAAVMAIFGVLWLRGREDQQNARSALADRDLLIMKAQETERELQARVKRATDALEALRQSSASRAEQAAIALQQWQERYRRLAHWEPVQDFAERERELKESVASLERMVEALRNTVEGYGSRYVVPPQTALDELAREMAHAEPAQALKRAREASRALAREGRGATCDYADGERAQLASNFALDAFNGKVEAILSSAKSDNVGTLRQKLMDAFVLVNQQGLAFRRARITSEYLTARMRELDLVALVQKQRQEERDEQRKVKEQMREEAKVQREVERAQREAKKKEEALQRERRLLEDAQTRAAEEQRAIYQARLQEELARATESERAAVEAEFRAKMEAQEATQRAEYEARIAEQDAKMAEILAARQRALSMAQQTKRGTVYIISNIGAFGERVFKIGQTRRLDPMDRIWELGDASVPFDFDVHALIQSDDAPKLEGLLHQEFVLAQVNKMNWRKEFFRADLTDIRRAVETLGLEAEWTMTAAAQQFRETQALEAQLEADPEFRERWIVEQRGMEFEMQRASIGSGEAEDEDESV
jgi:hypothetical protein